MKNSSPFWKTRKASFRSRKEYLSLPLWNEALLQERPGAELLCKGKRREALPVDDPYQDFFLLLWQPPFPSSCTSPAKKSRGTCTTGTAAFQKKSAGLAIFSQNPRSCVRYAGMVLAISRTTTSSSDRRASKSWLEHTGKPPGTSRGKLTKRPGLEILRGNKENTMDTVKEVLAAKGGSVFSVRPGATVFEALEVMADKGVGAVLVVDESGKLVGIFSERDYARKLEIRGKNARATFVRDVMTSEMLGVEPTTTVRECMSLMTARRIRHLPVLEKGQLVGMISIGDVVRRSSPSRS